MTQAQSDLRLAKLAALVNEISERIRFTLFEVGAIPLGGPPEPFHQLLDLFPGSRIIAFELDEALCRELNEKTPPDITFYSTALGRKSEIRTLYETQHPMCTSLYEPNEALLQLYNNMEVASLKAVSSISTVGLDQFTQEHDITDVDFIKIDIQGAELDVFKGGVETLKNVVFIVSEVEFIPHYKDQPLFGDVNVFLTEQGMMFHKLLGKGGRTLKPIIMNNNRNFASQWIWSDAVYFRNILTLGNLAPDKLLKMSVLSFIYGSPDVTFYCFATYDEMQNTNYRQRLFDILS